MILPLPMAIDATACLACRCRRAKQRLRRCRFTQWWPPLVRARARDHVVKLVRRLSPAWHRNTLPVTPRRQLPTNSSQSRRDFAGSGARAEARQVRATTRVTGLVSTASTHSAGYLGYCGYDPAAASLFVVTLRCGAGLPGYLLALVVTVVALHPGGRVTPIAAENARKCWSLGAGNQVTSVTRFFAAHGRSVAGPATAAQRLIFPAAL
jgi:hypothetical protein